MDKLYYKLIAKPDIIKTKDVINEKLKRYMEEGLSIYGNLPKLTKKEYDNYKLMLKRGDDGFKAEFIEKTIYYVIRNLAYVFARNDLEDINFEDTLSKILEYHCDYVMSLKSLDVSFKEFISFICIGVYRRTMQQHQYLTYHRQYVDIVTPKTAEWLNDKNDSYEFSHKPLILEEVKDKFYKYLSTQKFNTPEILKERFGFETNDNKSFEEIAESHNMTKAGSHDKYHRYMKRINKSKLVKELQEYSTDEDLNV